MMGDPLMSVVRFTNRNHVGWLEFNRPPVNAFTREMVDEVHDAVAATLADPDVRVLVVASAVERYFSAGADLNGKAWNPAKPIIEWNGAKWVGLDVPDFVPTTPPNTGVGPFIMQAEGLGRVGVDLQGAFGFRIVRREQNPPVGFHDQNAIARFQTEAVGHVLRQRRAHRSASLSQGYLFGHNPQL